MFAIMAYPAVTGTPADLGGIDNPVPELEW